MTNNNTVLAAAAASKSMTLVSGTNLADNLQGGGSNEEFFSKDGNDYVHGGGGNDLIHAGKGDDRLYGGDGDDGLIANGGNDHLEGGVGDDKLFGMEGNDTLYGGKGRDLLFGYKGNDVFVYKSLDESKPGLETHDILKPDTPHDAVPAFEGAGKAGGDKFDFTALGDLTWGKSLYVKDFWSFSYVCVDKNADGHPELEIAIYDGDVKAAQYTVDDFAFL